MVNKDMPADQELAKYSKCNGSVMTTHGVESDLLTNEVTLIFMIVNFAIICQIIVVFGTGTNIINIACFIKQGFRDPFNISLLGLTISDLVSLVSMMWQNICLNPLFYESDLPFDAQYIALLTAGIQHVAFTHVTCWMTAFIALERCLCVALPLQVKRILTRRRVWIINVAIYVIIYCSNIAPIYYTTRFATVPHPRKPNTTWLGIIFTDDSPAVSTYSYIINSCFLPFTSFITICVATVVLVIMLKGKIHWRRKFTAPGTADVMSSRDHAVSKMVVFISVLFIICYLPDCVIFIGIVSIPQFSVSGSYRNFNAVLISFSYILESINASFSMLIYYRTSSKYRQTFGYFFCFRSGKDQNSKDSKLQQPT